MIEGIRLKRERLLEEHKTIFRLMYYFGGSIMVKPQLFKYMHHFNGYSQTKFNKIIRELISANLMVAERTKASTILVLTKSGIALVRGVKISSVSTTTLRTSTRLRTSMYRNEIIINHMLQTQKTYEQLETSISNTNLLAPKGDITNIYLTLSTYLNTPRYKGGTAYERCMAVLKCLKSSNPQDVIIYPDVNDIIKLQGRGVFISRPRLDRMIFLCTEMKQPYTYRRLKEDLEIINKFQSLYNPDKLFISIFIDKHRFTEVNGHLDVWKRKHLRGFYMAEQDLKITVTTIDVKDQYFKGVSLELYN